MFFSSRNEISKPFGLNSSKFQKDLEEFAVFARDSSKFQKDLEEYLDSSRCELGEFIVEQNKE